MEGVSGIDSINRPLYDKSKVSKVQNITRWTLHSFNLHISSIVHEHLEAGSMHNRKLRVVILIGAGFIYLSCGFVILMSKLSNEGCPV